MADCIEASFFYLNFSLRLNCVVDEKEEENSISTRCAEKLVEEDIICHSGLMAATRLISYVTPHRSTAGPTDIIGVEKGGVRGNCTPRLSLLTITAITALF